MLEFPNSLTLSLKGSTKLGPAPELRVAVPRVLYLDIETLPMQTEVYQRKQYGNYLNTRMRNQVTMACWAARWLDSPTTYDFLNVKEMRGLDDSRIAESLTELVNQADLVVGHNVDAFDLAQLRTRAIIGNTTAPKSVDTYDTLKVARTHFTFEGNSLRTLCHLLGLPNKGQPPDDWARSIMVFHDRYVMQEVVAYCKGDVDILPAVHERLRKYDPSRR